MADDWRNRCDWCGWAFRSDGTGCDADSCSQRPMPELTFSGQHKREIRQLESELQVRALGEANALQRVTELEIEAEHLRAELAGKRAADKPAYPPRDIEAEVAVDAGPITTALLVGRRMARESATTRTLLLIAAERERQEQLKAAGRFTHTCADDIPDTVKLAVLTEENGEVARAVLERGRHALDSHGVDLHKELIQVAAVATAWAEALEVPHG